MHHTISATAATQSNSREGVSLANTFAWHLIPGAAGAVVFFALAARLRSVGIPPIGAFLVAGLFVVLPIELGYLLYQGRRLTGRPTLEGAVHYRQPVPRRTYWTLIPALVVWALVIALAVPSLKGSLFAWIPSWADDVFGVKDPGRYSQTTLLALWALALPVAGIAVPLVEELYFRGHLLPRLERLRSSTRSCSPSTTSGLRGCSSAASSASCRSPTPSGGGAASTSASPCTSRST